ncbi:hypothetical protein CKO23_18465 [Thiocystis violacea]|nr:hypothetical protein [Thiocystis violacea]
MADSILEDVRALRDQHTSSMGCDLDRIYADLKAREALHAAEGWIVTPPPASPPQESDQRRRQTRFARP